MATLGASVAMPSRATGAAWRRRIPTNLALAAIPIIGLMLRVGGIVARPGMDHDEALVFLLATCNERPYEQALVERRSPALTESTVADWQKFVQLRRPFCFGTIASDLKRMKLHPPLFHSLAKLRIYLQYGSVDGFDPGRR